MLVTGGLATLQGIWNLFSNEPLFPYIAKNIPIWPRVVLLVLFCAVTLFGIIFTIKIFQQTSKTHRQRVPVLPNKRIIVTDAPEYLAGFFENRTNIQGTKLAEPYIGKWIRISGSLSNVYEYGDFVVIFIHKPFPSPTIEMYFGKEWIEHISVLKIGDDTKVLGKIKEISSGTVTLENCELII